MDENGSLAMEQTEEVVTPQEEVEAAESGQARDAEGEKGTEAAEPSGREPKQSHEDNRRYQAARRSGETVGYQRAMEELNRRIARSGMTDPATGEAISTIEGLENYNRGVREARIRERAERESRPVSEVRDEEEGKDFLRELRARDKAEREQQVQEAQKAQWLANDIREFMARHPGVDVGRLEDSAAFRRFCGSRYGKEPLADLYDDWLVIAGGAVQAAGAKAESKAGRATGTGGGSGAEALTASQQRELDEWNKTYPQMKMTAKEFLSRN